MLPQIQQPPLLTAQTLQRIPLQKAGDKVGDIFRHDILIKVYILVAFQVLFDLVQVSGLERRPTHNDMVQKDSDGPRIHRPPVLGRQHLRGHIGMRAADCASPRKFCPARKVLAQAKVRQTNVSFRVEENVLGFEVPVDESKLVQVLQSKQHLGAHDPSLLFREPALVREHVEVQVASFTKLGNEVEVLSGLKGISQLDKERM
mmetsp:Transcript_11865/g.36182  ORF Transcript_11865/g.36182 Transcript_11865/m.36182 type:complete len:203 (+) Transcript_11865:3070-3678(+)